MKLNYKREFVYASQDEIVREAANDAAGVALLFLKNKGKGFGNARVHWRLQIDDMKTEDHERKEYPVKLVGFSAALGKQVGGVPDTASASDPSDSGEVSEHRCPGCHRVIYSRRFSNCRDCGTPLPAGLRLGAEEKHLLLGEKAKEKSSPEGDTAPGVFVIS